MTRASKSTFLAVGALGLAGLVGGAQASEVLYDEIPGGTVTIVASDLSNPLVTITLSNNVFTLETGSASSVGFDALGLTLDSFVFSAAPQIVTVTSPSAFNGTQIAFSALSLQNSGTSTVTNLGGGDYEITSAAATASGSYTVNGGTVQNVPGAPTTGLSGTIGIGGTSGTLGLDAITLGDISVGGKTIALTADIAFNGMAVPLPATAWLLISGLGLFGVPFLRRHRRTAA
ncbi:MAG: PEP-CTERM sorting domain-containing protein [Steroidobacteraceae bacterium]|jgi:hypothetical protein